MTVTTPDTGTSTLHHALACLEEEGRHGVLVTGRYRLDFSDWGDGPPLLFIHGLGDERRSYALLMACLRQHFRCIAYNLPVGGRDQARLRRYTHEELATDVFRLMDHLKIQAASLVGHSFGATVALRAMHAQAERVTRGLVMGGFANRPLSRRQWWLALAARYLGGKKTLSVLSREDYMHRAHFAPFAAHEPERWRFFLDQTGRTPLKAMGHWGHQLHRVDLHPLLPQIKQPVLILCGDQDPLVPQTYANDLFEKLPNGLMFQIENCGHLPMLTHPETVAEAFTKFVNMTACPVHLLRAAGHTEFDCSRTVDGNCESLGCATENHGNVACERAAS